MDKALYHLKRILLKSLFNSRTSKKNKELAKEALKAVEEMIDEQRVD